MGSFRGASTCELGIICWWNNGSLSTSDNGRVDNNLTNFYGIVVQENNS